MWRNPIPQLDEDFESTRYSIQFKFDYFATPEEAVKGINNVIAENGGKVKVEWLRPGSDNRARLVFPEEKEKE